MFHFFQVIGRLPSSPGSEGKINGPPGRRGAADAAGCIEGLWKRFLRWTGLGAGGFLSLTALAGLRVVVAPFGQTSHVMSAI